MNSIKTHSTIFYASLAMNFKRNNKTSCAYNTYDWDDDDDENEKCICSGKVKFRVFQDNQNSLTFTAIYKKMCFSFYFCTISSVRQREKVYFYYFAHIALIPADVIRFLVLQTCVEKEKKNLIQNIDLREC